MRFEWNAFEESAPFEPHRNVAFLGLREERTKPRVLRAVRCDVEHAQFFAGLERFTDGVNTVDQIIEVEVTDHVVPSLESLSSTPQRWSASRSLSDAAQFFARRA